MNFVPGQNHIEQEANTQIDFITRFSSMNCHHLVKSILDCLGMVSLANGRQVSRIWRDNVDNHIEQFSSDQASSYNSINSKLAGLNQSLSVETWPLFGRHFTSR